MFLKIAKGVLLFVLAVFYIQNIVSYADNWLTAIVYSKLNLVLLVCILYLASAFAPVFKPLCLCVLLAGVLFHAYLYYNTSATYEVSWQTNVQRREKCRGEKATWYSKMTNDCYLRTSQE
ncbi:MAG: hypothetical protein IJS26_03275 [Alphaproteobacteria bacterium]|nr:hypothetical protein [Alphaproteobacteria bacterium]